MYMEFPIIVLSSHNDNRSIWKLQCFRHCITQASIYRTMKLCLELLHDCQWIMKYLPSSWLEWCNTSSQSTVTITHQAVSVTIHQPSVSFKNQKYISSPFLALYTWASNVQRNHVHSRLFCHFWRIMKYQIILVGMMYHTNTATAPFPPGGHLRSYVSTYSILKYRPGLKYELGG